MIRFFYGDLVLHIIVTILVFCHIEYIFAFLLDCNHRILANHFCLVHVISITLKMKIFNRYHKQYEKKLQKELIEQDIPTQIQMLPAKEAENLCNRLAQNFNISDFTSPSDPDPTVRVVAVAGWYCPCGGTHVRSTGELKERGWSVKGLRCKKGVVRVRYGPKDD